jgi:hypothetical protein
MAVVNVTKQSAVMRYMVFQLNLADIVLNLAAVGEHAERT